MSGSENRDQNDLMQGKLLYDKLTCLEDHPSSFIGNIVSRRSSAGAKMASNFK